MLGVLQHRWADTDRRPKTVVADRRRLLTDSIDAGARRGLDHFLGEINWAAARGIGADPVRRRQPPLATPTRTRRRGLRRGVRGLRAAQAPSGRDRPRRRARPHDPRVEHTTDYADALRWRFRHVLVDEAQDLNPLQHRLLDLLRAGRDDLFLVGDPAQAIYGFNGADPALLVDVETRFPGVEVVRLPMNHRCTPQIVAGRAPRARRERAADDARVEPRPTAPAWPISTATDEQAEARRVAQLVARLDPALVRTGEVAVLARTNAQLAPITVPSRGAGSAVRRRAGASARRSRPWSARSTDSDRRPQLRAWAQDALEATSRRDAVPRHRQPPRRPRPCSTSSARAPSATEPVSGRGSPRPIRSTTATPGGVELLTFHAAKGREWHTVVLVGCEIESRAAPVGDHQRRPRPRRAGCSMSRSRAPPTLWSSTGRTGAVATRRR